MNLQQLRHFIALADHGSFTRAAERAHLTQPALSRSIGQLEAEFGMRLIDRIGRHNELTAFGREILDHARRVLFEADELLRVVKLQQGGDAGQIRIGLGSAPGALMTIPLLTRIARDHPNVRVTMTRGSILQQVEALRARALDMLVVEVRAVPPSADLHIENLPPLRAGFVCRSDHPVANGKKLDFEALLPWRIATTLLAEAQIRALVTHYGPQAHPDNCIAFRSEDINGLLEVVKASDTIYLGVLAPACDAIAAGSLVELPITPTLEGSQFAILRLGGRSVAPVFALVSKFVREMMTGWSAI